MVEREFKFNTLDKEFIIDNQLITPGENALVRMSVGRLPSDTRIYVTAHVYRSMLPGPTVLLLGGVHGDEINGIETLRGVVEEGVLEGLIRGNVIVIPLLNVFGFINFSREVPDGKDVNRSFPGSTSGSLASRVARVITKRVMPLVDYALDFHTGGASRYNYPQTRFSGRDEEARWLAESFRAHFTILKLNISKSFRKSCRDHDIPAIVYEGGESIRLDGFSITKARQGIFRVLNRLEMLENGFTDNKEKSILVKKTTWIRAPYSGIFIWSKQSGSYVQKNEPLGVIKDTYGLKSVKVTSRRSGYLIGHNNASVVNHGDALFNLAYEYEVQSK